MRSFSFCFVRCRVTDPSTVLTVISAPQFVNTFGLQIAASFVTKNPTRLLASPGRLLGFRRIIRASMNNRQRRGKQTEQKPLSAHLAGYVRPTVSESGWPRCGGQDHVLFSRAAASSA